MIRDLSQTKILPMFVPVTAMNEFGMKTVLVKRAWSLPKSFFSILGE
jgi:hypothetical protein